MNIALGTLISSSPTIASSGTKSTVVSSAGMSLVGITLPAAFTGTALTFEVSETLAGSYVPLKKSDGNSLSYTVAQGTYVAVNPVDFYGVKFFKIVSGSTESAGRTLVCSLKGL